MHAFQVKFSLIAVLSCIAMIGATPVQNSGPAGAIARRQGSNLGCATLQELCAVCTEAVAATNCDPCIELLLGNCDDSSDSS